MGDAMVITALLGTQREGWLALSASLSLAVFPAAGVTEAPRRKLIHHYKVNEDGAIGAVNLIIATGNNNLGTGHSITQVSRHDVDGNRLQDGRLNRV
jgi:coenzyme F420-reducing hydrogenase alpha subunit